MSANNKRKEIRDKIEELLNASTPITDKIILIQKNRSIAIQKANLPAIIIFNGDENPTEEPSRSGYKVNGSMHVRIISKSKLPPEPLGSGEQYADDELDDISKLVENVLTGPRFFLEGIGGNMTFVLGPQTFGASSENDKDTLYYLDMRFNYMYPIKYAIVP